ncbi:MAG: hypothetical protein VYA80_03560 [Pseudomonadota bacterium]|nr:hypothetical protein [Pseudomonadota bacterium]
MLIPNESQDNNLKSIIMVLGAARSGTTMLDLMLGNATDVFSCGEVWCLFRPHRKHHFEPKCLCGNSRCNVWDSLSVGDESKFHAEVLKQPDTNFVVDSSKDLRWLIDSHEWSRSSGINVTNVVTWKDPKSLAYSHWKRGRPIDYYRLSFIRYYGRLLDLGLPFISLSYNKIISDPSNALSNLCQHLGMQYQPGREEFWKKTHHHLFGSAGTAKQVARGDSKLHSESIEYPEEFNRSFEKLNHRKDNEVNELIGELAKREIGNLNSTKEPIEKNHFIKPLWYYYHSLKALYRKNFPSDLPIVD